MAQNISRKTNFLISYISSTVVLVPDHIELYLSSVFQENNQDYEITPTLDWY